MGESKNQRLIGLCPAPPTTHLDLNLNSRLSDLRKWQAFPPHPKLDLNSRLSEFQHKSVLHVDSGVTISKIQILYKIMPRDCISIYLELVIIMSNNIKNEHKPSKQYIFNQHRPWHCPLIMLNSWKEPQDTCKMLQNWNKTSGPFKPFNCY